MAHTLNEQSFTIGRQSTASNLIDEVLTKFSATMGWTIDRDNYTYPALKITEDGKFRIELREYNGKAYFLTYGNNFGLITGTNSNSYLTPSSSYNVYYHFSKTEKTKYLSIGTDNWLNWLFTENNLEEKALFVPYGTRTNRVIAGLENTTNIYNLGAMSDNINSNFDYSINMLPDYIRHSYYPEVYSVISAKNGTPDNLLVTFGDQTYRLVSMCRYAGYLTFAFPVE